ncbi:Aste57867_15631 [Aphanomyces stellatus]|uniref:peptide-methionine (S)-S-oxide reductase n=1 Tax=Aphanomyces stellatus TaxID=120398 RepID=A0A485L3I7_9STRA|nr:hypothetical protein As57867_015575 [Aphanomyces stellatus]VFT92428.1 Aste57867_15631 [Aphanomyces stellatus]
MHFLRWDLGCCGSSAIASDAPGDVAASLPLATFAAGCFWGVQLHFQRLDGVVESHVGYCGGTIDNPTYSQVRKGNTGHAEALQVQFDPARISYPQLLDKFWSMHNPTTKDQQKNDVGSQYRSAIFYHSEAQRVEAVASMKAHATNHDKPIVTEIVPAGRFFMAEDYHQKYLEKGGQCAGTGNTDLVRCYG